MSWKLALGAAFGFTHFAFVASCLVCMFYIDRKKAAETEFFIPVGYMFPPRRFLKASGLKFASIRFYSLIVSGIMLVVLLSIDLK